MEKPWSVEFRALPHETGGIAVFDTKDGRVVVIDTAQPAGAFLAAQLQTDAEDHDQ